MESATAGLAGGGLPGAVCPLFRLKPVVKAWPGAKTWLKDRVAVVMFEFKPVSPAEPG